MKIKNEPVGELPDCIPYRRLASEFQTPLCVIISAGEVLENYFDRLSPERRQLALEDILHAARQMNQTIDSFVTSEMDLGQNRAPRNPRQRRNRTRNQETASATL